MADTINWCPDLSSAEGPKYLALMRALREAIRSGELAEGAQLPTVRELAWQMKVTPGTVARAYSLATQEGLLAATVGRGTFVASRAPRLGPTQALYIERDPAADRGRVDLRAPILPDVGQNAAIADALREISLDPANDWVDYPRQSGEVPLREAICDWISDRVLGPFGADDIVLTHGGQNAINLVFLCCLRGDRPVVLTEELAYPGFRHAAKLARAEVVAVEIDNEGIRPEALEAACRRHGAQVLCLTPEAQNPTTGRMSPERRAAIVEISRRHDLQIIEDDCYSVNSSNWPSLRAMAPERAWYVGSLSKTVSAGLRFGYMIAPQGMGHAGRLTAQHSFFALARPIEAMVLHLLTSGEAARLHGLVQADLDERLQLAVNELGAFDLAWSPGVRFGFLRLPSGWRSSTFVSHAEGAGVLLRSADEYALVHGRAPNAVRIAFAGNVALDQYHKALRRLAKLLTEPPEDLMV
ncbi:aminotransferase-like domain-containing protein [Pseudotabrizicola sp. L79]|uniref:aminotransferase-like domain-containing protein n=1 Tax=Pseudotabrizicola sp. L79 TaxID=3118402 RepID=UPI002F91CF84